MSPLLARLPLTLLGAATIDSIGRVESGYQPATSNPGTISRQPGGVARNIAKLLAGFGNEPTLITALGDDPEGETLRSALAGQNVALREVRSGRFPTASYLALHDDTGELIAAIADMQIVESLDEDDVRQAIVSSPANGLLLADCGLSSTLLSVVAGNKGDRTFAVETVSAPKAIRLTPCLDKVDLLFTNTAEATALLGTEFETSRQTAEAILSAGIGQSVISDGRKDLTIVSNGEITTLPVPERPVIDVTGGGDALVAGTLFGLSGGNDLVEAAKFGLAAASISVEHAGAAPDISLQQMTDRRRSLFPPA